MSNTRGNASKMTVDEINQLISKLQALLPKDARSRCRSNTRASANKILKETCVYIKKLQEEVDGLTERLSELLASEEITDADAEIIRRLLQY